MIGNNSCGVHALMGGKTVDNIESLDVLLYDGTRMTLGAMTEEALEAAIAEGGRAGAIYAGLKRIRDTYASLVRERFPDIPRRVSGYNLDQLLPENGFHVARALVGSEATCITVLEATVRLVKSPQFRQLVVLGFADPFLAAEQSKAIVFLFASVDCPVSNRYAPVVQRLYETYAAQGVAFWLVYPNPAETPAAIRDHLKAFSYPVHALRDPRHELVKLARAVVTPEAAVFDRAGALAYHGRLDDRYVSLGIERPAATTHDLADAIAARKTLRNEFLDRYEQFFAPISLPS